MKAINYLLNLLIYMLLPFIMVFIFSYIVGFSYYAVVQDVSFFLLVVVYSIGIIIALGIDEEGRNPMYFIKFKNHTQKHD